MATSINEMAAAMWGYRCGSIGALLLATANASAQGAVIELTQAPSQFIESEGVDGGHKTGKTRGYTVTSKAGENAYSCPLNTTPDYKLIVQ